MGFKQICIYIYNYMNKNIELFKISTYNLKRVNYVKTIFTENEIKNELIYDNSYHIQYKDTDDVIILSIELNCSSCIWSMSKKIITSSVSLY